MSIRCSSTSLISGAIVCGVPGLGVLGSTILATTGSGGSGPGILFNDVQAGDDSKEFRAEVLTWPTAGIIDLQEDGRFTYTGPSADALSYRLWVDGVAMGTASVSLYGALAGVTLGAGSDATATADAGGAALFAYTLGAGADAVATADAGGGIASGLLLGAGADASATADAGGSALFAYALGGAADAVRLVDAGGAIGDGSIVWPAARAGEANTARVPFDGVRVIVPDADDPAAPVKAIPLYMADTERILVDWEAKYLPGAGDTAATVLALDAPAGVSVTPSVAPGAALTTGVVVLAVTPTGAAGTYRLALRISTAGGRESTALVDVVVSATVQSAKTFRLRSTADRDVFDLDFAAKYLAGAADVADVLLTTSADAGLAADARLDVGGVVQVAVDNPAAPGTYQVRTQLQTAAGRRKTGAIDVEVLA